jgi:hypothetical protein
MRVLLLGGGLPAYFDAPADEKESIFLPRFRAVLAEWEALGARVVASFCDDVLQVGPVVPGAWAWYLVYDVDDLATATRMLDAVRLDRDGTRLDKYVRFELRLGRPFFAREET